MIIGLILLGIVAIVVLSGQGFYPNLLNKGVTTMTATSTTTSSSATVTVTTSSITTNSTNALLIGRGPIVSIDQYCQLYQAQFGVSYCPVSSGGENPGLDLVNLPALNANLPYVAVWLFLIAIIGLGLIAYGKRKR